MATSPYVGGLRALQQHLLETVQGLSLLLDPLRQLGSGLLGLPADALGLLAGGLQPLLQLVLPPRQTLDHVLLSSELLVPDLAVPTLLRSEVVVVRVAQDLYGGLQTTRRLLGLVPRHLGLLGGVGYGVPLLDEVLHGPLVLLQQLLRSPHEGAAVLGDVDPGQLGQLGVGDDLTDGHVPQALVDRDPAGDVALGLERFGTHSFSLLLVLLILAGISP